MRVVALVSGGKDSCFSIYEAIVEGHEVVALVNMQPCDTTHNEVEIDSFMFQTVATEGITFFAEAMQIPLYQSKIMGTAVCQTLTYNESTSDEIEDLHKLLLKVKLNHSDVTGLISGAILSNYQRERVENLCDRLSWTSLSYLWNRDQKELLLDMISAGLCARIVKIAAYGLNCEKDLGMCIEDLAPRLFKLSDDPVCALNPCGEGGEFETFTFDCPLFYRRIVPTKPPVVVIHSSDPLVTVAYLRYNGLELQEKFKAEVKNTREQLLTLEGIVPSITGTLLRRPFCSLQERLASLKESVPKEISSDLLKLYVSVDVELKSDKNAPAKLSANGIFPISDDMLITKTLFGISTVNIGTLYQRLENASKAALDNVETLLASVDVTLDEVIHCNVVTSKLDLSTAELFKAINEPFKHAFDTPMARKRRLGNIPPSRICLSSDWPRSLINHLNPDLNISSEDFKNVVVVSLSVIVAAKNVSVEGMRVRSLSHWAPAVIAPYSQAVRIQCNSVCLPDKQEVSKASDNRVLFSGQIGLLPETSELPEDVVQQSWLALRNTHRVMQVMEPRCWQRLTYAIVYSTSLSGLQLARSQFHASVCPFVPTTESCLCDRRLCWVLVGGLPKGATVEWHFSTASSSIPTANHRSVFLDPDEEICEHCMMFVKVKGGNFNDVAVSADFPAIFPVLGFLQSSVKRVVVMLT